MITSNFLFVSGFLDSALISACTDQIDFKFIFKLNPEKRE
jgi:hypothetical protein